MTGIFLFLLIGYAAAQYPDNRLINRKTGSLCNLASLPNARNPVELPPSYNNVNAAIPQLPVPIYNREESIAPPSTQNPHNEFSTKLFQVVANRHAQQNVIYSPISMQTLLALIYTGASGNTAAQLRNALSFSTERNEVYRRYKQLLLDINSPKGPQLIMANKMYYADNLQINEQMSNRAKNYFDAELQPISFSMPQQAAADINYWVAGKTNNRIQNLISTGTLDQYTQAILVNAIYFKGNWTTQFSITDTQPQNFHINRQQVVPVEMMFNDDTYRYAELRELDAKVLEIPYLDSDLSMMIILPNKVEGLAALEQSLGNFNLNDIAKVMKPETVTLRMPKFKFEFDLDMVQPLQRLGITDLFSSHAQLYNFFRDQNVQVSKVQHKAFIEVNEAGSEAAAASFAKIVPLSLPVKEVYFTADHPFIFAIRSPSVVYFIGHVVNF